MSTPTPALVTDAHAPSPRRRGPRGAATLDLEALLASDATWYVVGSDDRQPTHSGSEAASP